MKTVAATTICLYVWFAIQPCLQAQLPDANKIQAAIDIAIQEKQSLENDPGYRDLTTKEIKERLKKIAQKTAGSIAGLPFAFHCEVTDIDEKDRIFVRVLEIKDRKKSASVITLDGPEKLRARIKKGTVVQFKGKVRDYNERSSGDLIFYLEVTPKNSEAILGQKNFEFLELLGYKGSESTIVNRVLFEKDHSQCIGLKFSLRQDSISILSETQAAKIKSEIAAPDPRVSIPLYEDPQQSSRDIFKRSGGVGGLDR